MSADARRELGELLADELDNIDPLTLREQRDLARNMAVKLWDEITDLERQMDQEVRRFADRERANVQSRRSLCDQSDRYLERAKAAEAELAVMQDERDTALLRAEKAETRGCWRCGGTS